MALCGRALDDAIAATWRSQDPGNLEADIQAGATTGFSLLWWFLVVSLGFGTAFQCLAGKVGLVTGKVRRAGLPRLALISIHARFAACRVLGSVRVHPLLCAGFGAALRRAVAHRRALVPVAHARAGHCGGGHSGDGGLRAGALHAVQRPAAPLGG
jgi:hypothetical protein